MSSITVEAYLWDMILSELKDYIDTLPKPTDSERLLILNQLVSALKDTPSVVFVCTHNSRRSHMASVWAKIMADTHGVELESYSAGTEATEFNIRAVDALRRCGLDIESDGEDRNPVYLVRYSGSKSRIHAFSKTLEDPSLPKEEFISVMCCADADAHCPIQIGAVERIPLRYVDPKVADDTEAELETYSERCQHIASEMNYVMSQLAL